MSRLPSVWYLWVSLTASSVMPSAAACRMVTDSDSPTRLCFEHLGPQDKPMPRFCLVRRSVSLRTGDIAIDEDAAWEAAVAFYHEPAGDASARLLGTYSVTPDRAFPTRMLSPATMRRLIGRLVEYFHVQGTQVPPLIDQLQRRIGLVD